MNRLIKVFNRAVSPPIIFLWKSGKADVLIIFLCMFFVAWINPLADKIEDGNRLFKEGQYDEALTKYTEVMIDSPNSPYAHFNIGSSHYKKENYDEAVKSFSKAASLASDPVLESKAYYNLGNSKYKQGKLKENTKLGDAISLYRESLDYYKQALDRNPENTKAKYNHEFVERKIKELLDKQKQQVQEQQQEQNQGEQQEQENQQGESNQQEEDKPQGNKDGEENTPAVQAQESQQDEGQQSEQKEGMTAEEAKMLLDSLKDEELSELMDKKSSGNSGRILKDW
ncbi:tetratricopeptide repeat protein [Candidatus Poribacteria bacterium]|nr:tetratricopeptide repeat protein [Candidatus Poribacteria bacterium]